MEYIIKQLKQNGEVFFPQTSAESVLVKSGQEVITLDIILSRKIENISSDSSLTITKNASQINIFHSNIITPNSTPSPLLIKHDQNGHISETQPAQKLIVTVASTAIEHDGSKQTQLNMGDDFTIEDDKIQLNWNNIIK